MSDIEQRARDALNEVYRERNIMRTAFDDVDKRETDWVVEAMCREIEAHDATKSELAELRERVSNAFKTVKAYLDEGGTMDTTGIGADGNYVRFSDFIQPEPVKVDLLDEIMRDAGVGKTVRDEVSAALAKRGGKIVWEGDAK